MNEPQDTHQDADAGRHETDLERADRNLGELLQELVQPGTFIGIPCLDST